MNTAFKIGHYTDEKNITGCTVILCPEDTTASCHIFGSAPGSRETALLAPQRKVNGIQALLLTGGSAFGLDAAAGVVKYLEEKNLGYPTAYGNIPLVSAAVIFDRNIGNPQSRPIAENAYQACLEAKSDFGKMGSIGAGTGATVGKWAGLEKAMKGGIGISSVKRGNIHITAISVINAVGDIIDNHGEIVAGAHDSKGNFLAATGADQRWEAPQTGLNENTVLSAVLCNAKLSKLEVYTLACRAQNGFARAIIPASTSYDGDVIFALASGSEKGSTDMIYEMAAEAVRESIVTGVQSAQSLGGIPSCNNFKK